MRKWIVAIGAGALLSGIALYVVTIVAVPVAYRDVPQVCVTSPSNPQECADAQARLSVMHGLQPLAWFIAGLGVVFIVLGLVLGERAIPPDLGTPQA